MFSKLTSLAVLGASVAQASQMVFVENSEAFVQQQVSDFVLDQDFSVSRIPNSDAAVVVCESNCELLKGGQLMGDNVVSDWFTLRLGGEKDRSSLNNVARVAELSHVRELETHQIVEAGEYTYAIVSVPDAFVLDQLTAPYPEKELISFTPKMVDATYAAEKRFVNDQVIRDVNARLSEDRYFDLLAQLSGDEPIVVDGTTYNTVTRATQSPLHLRAAEWAFDFFEQRGLEVSYQSVRVGNTNTKNVVAVKRGVGPRANEVVVVGAHYDSISQNSGVLAPGAVDNGSGSVGVMVLADAMQGVQFDRTIHFVLFCGEEQGLFGSQEYVRLAQQGGTTISTAILMDMIAYSNRYFGVTIEGTTNRAIQTLMDTVEENTKRYATRLQINRSNNSFGSDHVPFQRAGIPAILLIELDDTNYPHYHRTTDNMLQVNAAQSVDIVKALSASTIVNAVPIVSATTAATE